MWRQRKLREVCGENKIHVSAYSPLGGPGNAWGSFAVVDSPIIQSIALKHNATPAQVPFDFVPPRLNSRFHLQTPEDHKRKEIPKRVETSTVTHSTNKEIIMHSMKW